MKTLPLVLFCGILVGMSGCASAGSKKVATDRLSLTTQKLEAAEKENHALKQELVLCRKFQRVDTRHFLEACGIFEKTFAKEIKNQLVALGVSDRGLIIVVFAEALFDSGNASLSEEGRVFLEQLLIFMQENFPDNYIYVEGHTDNQSLAIFEWKSDWDFSFARALNIVQFLKEKRVDPLRLSAAGFGQYRPRASNETKDGRRLNRRIEIVISPQRVGYMIDS